MPPARNAISTPVSRTRAIDWSAWSRKTLSVQLLQQFGSRNGSWTSASPTAPTAAAAYSARDADPRATWSSSGVANSAAAVARLRTSGAACSQPTQSGANHATLASSATMPHRPARHEPGREQREAGHDVGRRHRPRPAGVGGELGCRDDEHGQQRDRGRRDPDARARERSCDDRSVVGDGDDRVQVRPAARAAVDAQGAAERLDPVREPAKPRAARRVGTADTVVGDVDREVAVAAIDADRDPRRRRVLRPRS